NNGGCRMHFLGEQRGVRPRNSPVHNDWRCIFCMLCRHRSTIREWPAIAFTGEEMYSCIECKHGIYCGLPQPRIGLTRPAQLVRPDPLVAVIVTGSASYAD